jgi:glyoxylase-like metal-dependent hydrolase (beta-lactamase superfamily II)
MRVLALPRNDRIYSSNSFLVLGPWSRIEDVNVLVDAGADPEVLPFIDRAPTGVGKRKVDLIVLTHRHYDHSTMAPAIRQRYGASVAAFGPRDELVDQPLRDGMRLRLGEEDVEVIHTPGHTDDSICLYAPASGILFVGDTPVVVNSTDGSYEPAYIAALKRLAVLPVRVIYFGHGDALTEGCERRLQLTLSNVERSTGKPAGPRVAAPGQGGGVGQ